MIAMRPSKKVYGATGAHSFLPLAHLWRMMAPTGVLDRKTRKKRNTLPAEARSAGKGE
jgi:hypothetical protein